MRRATISPRTRWCVRCRTARAQASCATRGHAEIRSRSRTTLASPRPDHAERDVFPARPGAARACSLCPPRNVRAPSNQRHERLHQDRDAWKFHHRLAQKVPNGKSFSRNSWLRRGCTYARRIRWFGSTSISASRISTARATSHQAGAYVAAPGACERTVTPPWTGPVRHASQQARDVCLVAASERARAYV